MNSSTQVFFLLAVVTCVTAWPIKKDDLIKLNTDGEAFVEKNKKEFKDEVAKEEGFDTNILVPYFEELKQYLIPIMDRNAKLSARIRFVSKRVTDITTPGITRTAGKRLHVLTTLIGEGDKVPEILLSFTHKWLDDRANKVENPEKLDKVMVDLMKEANDVKILFETFTTKFTAEVTALRNLVAEGSAADKVDEVTKASVDMVATCASAPSIEGVENILAKIEELVIPSE